MAWNLECCKPSLRKKKIMAKLVVNSSTASGELGNLLFTASPAIIAVAKTRMRMIDAILATCNSVSAGFIVREEGAATLNVMCDNTEILYRSLNVRIPNGNKRSLHDYVRIRTFRTQSRDMRKTYLNTYD